jgi:plasmid stabilization system protein ParE
MTYHVVVQPRAKRDIQLAAHWILGQSGSPATAVRWARKLRATIATLKSTPQRCPIDPDSEVYGEEVRVLLYGKRRGVHRVLFTIRGDTAHVLTVRHSAQRSLAEETADDDPDEGEEPVH